MKRRKTYGVLVPILHGVPRRTKNRKMAGNSPDKIDDIYHVLSFPMANNIFYECKGLEGNDYNLWDIDRTDLQAKQIRNAIHVTNHYQYEEWCKENLP